MIRLRSSAATAGHVRVRSSAAAAGHVRVRSSAATARQALMTAAFVAVGGSSSVFACPMCFGAEETAMVDGTKLGILAMLAITVAVQGGFAGFFLYLRKCAKRAADVELDTEWSELQKPSRPS